MNRRAITVRFMDGTKISFDFPELANNTQAKGLKLEDFFKSPYLVVEAEGTLMMFPVANIKSLEMLVPMDMSEIKLPAHAIRGAHVIG